MKLLRPVTALLAAVALFAIPGAATAASSSATVCYNLDCPSSSAVPTDHGGPLVTRPVIYLVRFSASRTHLTPSGGYVASTFASTEPNAVGAIRASITPVSSASWWMSQYSRPTQLLHYGRVGGIITLYSPVLSSAHLISDATIDHALLNATIHRQLPRGPNDVFVLFFRSHQIITASGGADSKKTFCAYHSYVPFYSSSINYVVMPNESAASGCAYGIGLSAFAAETAHLSHELVEAITDPASTLAWSGPANTELADLCESGSIPVYADPTPHATYELQLVYAVFPGGCFGLPVPVTLTPSQPVGSTLSVSVSLGAHGTVVDQPLSLYEGTTLLATSSTDATSTAVFSSSALSSLPNSTILTVTYDGNGPLDSAAATFLVSSASVSPMLQATLPTSLATMSPSLLDVTVTPAQAGQPVYLAGTITQTLATTAVGSVGFSFLAPSGPGTYLVAVTNGTKVLSLTLAANAS